MSKNKWLIVITWAVDKLPKAVLRWTAQVEHLSIEDSGMFFLVRRRRYVESQLVSEDAQRISITSTDLMQTILLMSLRKAADSGFVLYRHSSQIFRYCRETLLSSKVPYGIWFDNDVNFNWGAQHLLQTHVSVFAFARRHSTSFATRSFMIASALNLTEFYPSLTKCAHGSISIRTFICQRRCGRKRREKPS